MKRGLCVLAVALALCAPVAYAQTQPSAQLEAEDEAFENAYQLVLAGLNLNESCKSILDPKHYEGFKTILHIDLEAMGADAGDIKKADEAGALLSGYICDGKADCWRTALEMPATATVEDGRSKCASTMIEILAEIDAYANPDKQG